MAPVTTLSMRLVAHMRSLVENAKGNVVSISLRSASKAVGAESRAEVLTVKAALDTLVSLGLLEAFPKKKPVYAMRRGSPLWNALEGGHIELVTAVVTKCIKKRRYRRRRRPGEEFAGNY
jgi:hypothetical protein